MTHIELYRETETHLDLSHGPDYSTEQGPVGDFRWRMVHTNGNVVGASTEGYADKRDCIWNLKFVTGGRFDKAGTVLRRRFVTGSSRHPFGRWQEFEVRDLTQNGGES